TPPAISGSAPSRFRLPTRPRGGSCSTGPARRWPRWICRPVWRSTTSAPTISSAWCVTISTWNGCRYGRSGEKENRNEEAGRGRLHDAGRGRAGTGGTRRNRDGGFEHGGWLVPFFDED